MNYVKIIANGNTYGPIRAPTTLSFIIKILKISKSASPMLQMLNTPTNPMVIIDLQEKVLSGLYELLYDTDVGYDSAAECTQEFPVHHNTYCTTGVRKDRLPVNHYSSKTATTITESLELVAAEEQEFPLKDGDMSECLKAMMELISSIPPRYIKYNVKLSAQIDAALAEVNEWSLRLNSGDEDEMSWKLKKTFIQYRIIHILHETWKTVWQQFSPYARSFQTTKIVSFHAFDVAEGYLNRLWSWRRMLSDSEWRKLRCVYSKENDARRVTHFVPMNAKNRILKPPPLPSSENAQTWTYLVRRPLPKINSAHENSKNAVHSFRLMFIDAMINDDVHSRKGISILLNDLLLKESANNKNFPVYLIRDVIQSEFLPDDYNLAHLENMGTSEF